MAAGGRGPGTGAWYILQSSDGFDINLCRSYVLGDQSTDLPVPGDYDGDGKTDIAIWRPSSGTWFLLQSSDGYNINLFKSYVLGDQPTDQPVPGDYDGDGKTDLAVWRPSTGYWYILQSSDGYNINQIKSYNWGNVAFNDVTVRAAPGVSPVRKNAYDVRDYVPLRPGDFSFRFDGHWNTTTEITVGTVRDSEVPLPLTLIKLIQRDGSIEENVFGFDPADEKMKLYGSYRGTPRVYYRNTPPIVVGTTSMRVGDSFVNSYTATNTNSGDNTAEFFNVVFTAVETVSTPAGTFDNCVKYEGTNTLHEVLWTNWFAPGIGQVKEITDVGYESPVHYLHIGNTSYGTPLALSIPNISGMFYLDVEMSTTGNGGARRQKGIYDLVHDSGSGALSVQRFFPDGTQLPRTGTLAGSTFTLSGMSHGTPSVPQTAAGVFSPEGDHFVGQWWNDSAPDVRYGITGEIIRPAARGNGDADIYFATACNDNDYYSRIWTTPVSFGGFSTATQINIYGVDTSASWNRMEWDYFDSTGFYLLGNQEDNVLNGPFSPPVLLMPNRFTLGTTYTNYNFGGGHSAQYGVDSVGTITVPLGTFLSVRIHGIDSSVSTFHNYNWVTPGIAFTKLKGEREGSSCTDSLAWQQSNGATFGNQPTTVPFSVKFTNFAVLYLREEANGTRRYYFDVEVKTPAGGMVPDNTIVQDVHIYAYPSMTEIPLSGSWNTWRGSNFYYDSDGAGVNPPNPYPYSGVMGYLNVAADALSPGFYKIVVTDDTGQSQSNWLYHEPPTETGKVQAASMGKVNNGNGSVTLSWTPPPSQPLDSAKHFLRVYVGSTVDYTGNGSNEQLLMVHLPATATSYTIPAAEVARLKGFASLYWSVQVREQYPWLTNPDGSIRTYHFYRNQGQTTPLEGLP